MRDVSKIFFSIYVKVALLFFSLRCAMGWSTIFTILCEKNVIDGCYTVIGYAGEAVFVASLFMAVFNKWLWKIKFMNKLIGEPVIISGYYVGKIESEYDHVVRTAELYIKQTLLSVDVRMKTNESVSNAIAASIENINNEKQLVYIYINEPKGDIQERSPMHYGTAILHLENLDSIYGNYYTGRKTRGSMSFSARNK